MLNPEKPGQYSHLKQGLADLVRDLRRQRYQIGIDQYLAAQSLFLIWEQKAPLSMAVIRASLAAVFCSDYDEQQRFSHLFETWYNKCSPKQSVETADEIGSKEPLAPPSWYEKIGLDGKTVVAIILWAIFLCLLLFRYVEKHPMLVTQSQSPTAIPDTISAKETEKAETVKKQVITSKPDQDLSKPIKPITREVKKSATIPEPKSPPEPVIIPREFYPPYQAALETSFYIPIIIWLAWLARRSRLRYVTLSRRRAKKNEIVKLDDLRFNVGKNPIFPAWALKPVWQLWRKNKPFRSRRLHNVNTINRTLARSGFFQPIFRDRLLPPEYVLLIDRRHRDDFSAGLGQELKQRMQAEGLFVKQYQYDTDPRYCWPVDQHTRYYSLEQLADRHQGQNLIIVGEACSFFPTLNTGHIPWGQQDSWMQQVLLTVTPPEDWREPEQALMALGFQVTPFTRRGILKLLEQPSGNAVQNQHIQAVSLDYRDAALPHCLRPYVWPWLDERVPDKHTRTTVLTALKAYLGEQGFNLLAAIASYPALDWELTLALDQQLQLDADEQREIRLRILARLPWLRNGRLPDIWRKLIIRSLSQPEFNKINACYEALMNAKNQEGLIDLPVAIPDLSKAKNEREEWINTAPYGDPLQDYVFASVICGRKPRLLEFTLPWPLKNRFPKENWRGLLLPAVLGLLLAAGIRLAAIEAWQHFGKQFLEQQAKQNLKAAFAKYVIDIEYNDAALKKYAQTLKSIYIQWGFNEDNLKLKPTQGDSGQKHTQSTGQHSNVDTMQSPTYHISYNPKTAPNVVEMIKLRLSYLADDAPVELIERGSIAENTVLVQIRQAFSPVAVQPDLIQSKKIFILEPDMVSIPGRAFQMGSTNGNTQEVPVHTVNIKPFAIGRYEVTFDEYDQFVTAKGITRPIDNGWGRGSRPVINVSWDDAKAYAAWLSKETGLRYRLPTEAEWEYAARARTETAFFWGEDPEKAEVHAWFSKNSGYKTQPVGANGHNNKFELYDMAGNVWEWTADCLHENYIGAPTMGEAWQEANNGDCSLHVLRGGSWGMDPDRLRSADRGWSSTGLRGLSIGFRLAQDLP